jgi:hypothetical protein
VCGNGRALHDSSFYTCYSGIASRGGVGMLINGDGCCVLLFHVHRTADSGGGARDAGLYARSVILMSNKHEYNSRSLEATLDGFHDSDVSLA